MNAQTEIKSLKLDFVDKFATNSVKRAERELTETKTLFNDNVITIGKGKDAKNIPIESERVETIKELLPLIKDAEVKTLVSVYTKQNTKRQANAKYKELLEE